MKKLIYMTMAFILMAIVIGCRTPEQRKELYDQRNTIDLRNDVGSAEFVGPGGLDANGLMYLPITEGY